MGKLIMRKLNNTSGKSIFMALLLLLVAVVVSVVIVTVAITSVMHVQDNKTSQQEYLACASAADLIKDCVAGSEYVQTYTEWIANDKYTDDKDLTEKTETSADWSTGKKPKGMQAFAEEIVEPILKGTNNPQGEFTISVNGDTNNKVTVDYKLVNVKTVNDPEKPNTTVTSYCLKFKLSSKYDEDSNEYRMTMVVPITKTVVTQSEKNQKQQCKLKSPHVKRGGYNRGETVSHNFTKDVTTTTITWENANGTGIAITKGWDEYDKA